MKKLSVKKLWCQFYKALMRRFTSELDGNNLGRSAIVFSPHQDDETLGCGGTLIKKKRAGANVKIVFMTDGCRSHPHIVSEDEMKALRAKEALAAARTLGIEQSDVIFLEFKDGELNKSQDAAIHKVAEILLRERPDEVFIPYHREPLLVADHFATNNIVMSALKMSGIKAIIYEYPIWFWRHWPWTSFTGTRQEKLTVLQGSFVENLGLSLVRDFRISIDVRDVLELKRSALAQHKSQMTQLIPDPSWQTLHDVSDGEFLECFFQDYEFFRCSIPDP